MQCIYPHTLVPYRGLKKQMCFDEILQDVDGLKSARRINGSKSEFEVDEDCKRRLPDDVMKELHKELPDLSMNLLTDDSPVEYLKFIQKGDAGKAWHGEDIDVAKCIKSVEEVKGDYYPLVFNISEIHNKEFPYDSTFQSNNEIEKGGRSIVGIIGKKSTPYCKDKTSEVIGKFSVIHKPTNMNYWHVTLRIEIPKGSEPLKRGKAKQKRRFATEEILKAVLEKDYESTTRIRSKHYIDSNVCKIRRLISKWKRDHQCYCIP